MEIINIDERSKELFFNLKEKTTLKDLNNFLQSSKNGVYEVFADGSGSVLLSDAFMRHRGETPLYELFPTSQRMFVRCNKESPYRVMELTVKTLTGQQFQVQVNTHSSVHDLKLAVEKRMGAPGNQQRFAFNGKGFEQDDHELRRYGLFDGCIVHLVLRLRGGGGEIPFADVSNEKGKQTIQLSVKAPAWRIVAPGLHIEGVCSMKSCKAHKQTVISRHRTGLFRIEKTDPRCPCCRKSVTAVTMGFFDCFYRMRARKTGSLTEFSTPWAEVENEYVRWDEQKAGVVEWDFLQVEVRARDRAMKAPSNALVERAPKPLSCVICFEFMDLHDHSDARMLKCLHTFHDKCMSDWEKAARRGGQEATCPLCRADI